MHTHYRAILRGDRLEWLGEAPESRPDAPLSVQVTIVDPEPVSEEQERSRGLAMAALLEKLANRGTFSAITDPVEWQRELRRERALPGREG
jgi:hypothetical protein